MIAPSGPQIAAPTNTAARAMAAVAHADGLLVVGSSLMAYSAFRLCKAMVEQGKPVIEQAVAQAQRFVAEGADCVDVGGMSTRPGHALIPVEEELARVTALRAAANGRLAGLAGPQPRGSEPDGGGESQEPACMHGVAPLTARLVGHRHRRYPAGVSAVTVQAV